MKSKNILYGCAFPFLLLLASTANADNTSEIRGITIPASMCQPANSESAAKLELGTSWKFKHAVTGVATLRCPFPISNIRATQNAGSNYLDHYYVMFYDPDQSGTDHGISIELRSQDRVWNRSISYTKLDDWTFPPSSGRIILYRALINLPSIHTIDDEAFYSFSVQLTSAGNPYLQFTGISFQ